MPARRVKAYLNNPNTRNHREHRSKRGRQPSRSRWAKFQIYRSKLKELEESDLELESEPYNL